MKLQRLIDRAVQIVAELQTVAVRPILAYSGGKDSLVVAHIIQQAGLMPSIHSAVCETSFYMQRQLEDIQDIAQAFTCDVIYKDSLDWSWLRQHPEVVFSNDPTIRGWSFAQRHQKSVADYAREHKADAIVFGRRTQENTVPSHLYYRKQVQHWSCHPIREWTTDDVWEYIQLYNVRVPWIYSNDFGKHAGNAPFYTLRARSMGGVDQAWDLITSLDPTITKERMEM